MTRKEFIKMCGILGISIPLYPSLLSAGVHKERDYSFEGKVLIIGAGAAGLTAAYALTQMGIDCQILEASPNYGGRMKTSTDFVDFPIPLGAEWLHVKRRVLDEIINENSVEVAIETKGYKLTDYGLYHGEETSMLLMLGSDRKFVGSSWLNFFEDYLIPSIYDKILFNQVVTSIDYSGDTIVTETLNETYESNKVIMTVPVKMLQKKAIDFTPRLPDYKLEAIDEVTVWDGFKAFIEFTDKFYPTAIELKVTPEGSGQKMYYDASYGQNSKRNVLGFFSVGSATLPYRRLSDADLIKHMLKELDEMFDGKASACYIKHISQNWTNEPFVEGGYVYDDENWRNLRTLGKSVADKVFFAGTSYTEGEDWGGVHSAAYSAMRAVNEILESN